ncbi:MAG: hypothetical protein HYR96_02360 [Deltaproteobacteria bacterium]|nr:hypothetical protein [Deltaproteobacteria bacterium]MBI3293151.1 hypothetical protein [Deltaproteobacteria bacterium]
MLHRLLKLSSGVALLSGLFAVVFLRGLPRWQTMPLWAEDGNVFLWDTFQFGWKSFFHFYAGYYHLFPRLMILLLSSISLQYLAHLIFLCSLGLFCLVAFEFSRERYANVLPDRITRVFLSFAFCFTPGLSENLGNLGNAHWFLSLYLCLLLIRNRDNALSAFDWLMVILAAFSAGECLLFIPMAFLRGYWVKSDRTVAWGIAAIIGAGVILNLFAKHETIADLPTLQKMVEAYFYSLVTQLWIHPFFGDEIAYRVGDTAPVFWLLVILFAASLWATFRIHTLENRLLFLFVVGASLYPILYGSVRPDGLRFWSTMRRDPGLSIQRQSYLMGVAGLLYVVNLFSNLAEQKPILKPLPIVFMILYVALALPHFGVHTHDPKYRWDDQIAWHREHSTQEILMMVAPFGWEVPVPPGAYQKVTLFDRLCGLRS